MPRKKKETKPVHHKKLDQLFSEIEKVEKETKEIEEITFQTLKAQNKKKK